MEDMRYCIGRLYRNAKLREQISEGRPHFSVVPANDQGVLIVLVFEANVPIEFSTTWAHRSCGSFF
jgi:hypothetical protein